MMQTDRGPKTISIDCLMSSPVHRSTDLDRHLFKNVITQESLPATAVSTPVNGAFITRVRMPTRVYSRPLVRVRCLMQTYGSLVIDIVHLDCMFFSSRERRQVPHSSHYRCSRQRDAVASITPRIDVPCNGCARLLRCLRREMTMRWG
jgi:hypothetical protein